MTHCHNCGHAGTFVLVVQFALVVPDDGPDPDRIRARPRNDLSLSVQCPACDSTDVSVAAVDLLARYGSNTTS